MRTQFRRNRAIRWARAQAFRRELDSTQQSQLPNRRCSQVMMTFWWTLVDKYRCDACRRDRYTVVRGKAHTTATFRLTGQSGACSYMQRVSLATVTDHQLRRMREAALKTQPFQKLIQQCSL